MDENAAMICGEGSPFTDGSGACVRSCVRACARARACIFAPPTPLPPSMEMINGVARKVNSTRENGILSVMHLLEPSGRKFAELGSGAPPVVVEEEEGADAAITPETLCQSPHLKHPAHFFCVCLKPPPKFSFSYCERKQPTECRDSVKK